MAALEKHALNERNAAALKPNSPFVQRMLERVRGTLRRTFVTHHQVKGDDIVAIDPNGSEVKRSSQYATFINELRKMWSGNANMREKAEVDVSGIVGDTTPEDFHSFVEILRLEDIREDLSRGIKRAVGYDLPEVHAKLNELHRAASQGTQAMLRRHSNLMQSIKNMLVEELGIVDNGREFYYPHRVLDYIDELAGTSRPPAGPRWNLSRNVKNKRGGTIRELDMNYIDVMEKYLTDQYTMMARRKMVRTLLQSVDLRATPNKYLGKDGQPIVWNEGDPIPEGFHLYNEMTGMQRLRATSIAERMMFETVDLGGLEAYAKHLGIDRALLDAEINRLFGSEEGFSRAIEASGIGKKDHMYLIPDDANVALSEVMNNLGRLDREGAFSTFTRYWKTGVLNFAPIRYNFRNFIGDFQRAYIQFGNEFFKDTQMLKEVWDDTYNYYIHKSNSPHMRGMLDNAVSTSGMWGQETALSVRRPDFLKLQHQVDLSTADKARNFLWNGLRWVPELSAMREDLMRGFIYQMNLRRARAGQEMLTGIADKDIVTGLLKNEDYEGAAAYIARESLGDYGDLTFQEQKVRNGLLPFYGWMKVNTQFWGGLTKAIAEGRAEGAMARASFAATARATAIAATVMGMARAWNELQHGDIEEELPDNIRKTSHVILGRDENGKPIVISLNDAMDDMLTMLGADKALPELYSVMRGTLSKEEYLRRQQNNALLWGVVPGKGVVRQTLSQLGPVPQMLSQGILRKRMFPDPLNPTDVPPEQFASSIRDILGVGALGLDKFATDIDLTKGQVFQPTTLFFDIPRQLGYRKTSAPTMMQEVGATSRYQADLIKQLGKIEKDMQDLEGRYGRLVSGEANRQLDPDARSEMVEAMNRQRDQLIAKYKEMAARYQRLTEATR